jgi:hypothetical protein
MEAPTKSLQMQRAWREVDLAKGRKGPAESVPSAGTAAAIAQKRFTF